MEKDLLKELLELSNFYPELNVLFLVREDGFNDLLVTEDDGETYIPIGREYFNEKGLTADMIDSFFLGEIGVHTERDEVYVADGDKNIIVGNLGGKYDELEDLKDVIWIKTIVVFIGKGVVH